MQVVLVLPVDGGSEARGGDAEIPVHFFNSLKNQAEEIGAH